jgi:hypothetical protein
VGIQTALDAVAEASTIVDGMRSAEDLAFEAGRDPGVRTLRVLSRAIQGSDQLVVIAAIHALAEINDGEAGRLLVRLLDDDRAFVREHATWAVGNGMPRPEAVGRLLALIVAGGFTGMLAQRTLELWSTAVPELLVVGVEGALLGVRDPSSRSRLVETLGLVRSALATGPLVRIVGDRGEPEAVRVAATAALGQRTSSPDLVAALESLKAEHGRIGDAALLALLDLEAAATPIGASRTDALTVAQLFLHADIDPSLSAAGAGDNGGIATLLVRLGDALVAIDDGAVSRVITLSRGSIADAAADLISLRGGERGHVAPSRLGAARHPSPLEGGRRRRPAAPADGGCRQSRGRGCRP